MRDAKWVDTAFIAAVPLLLALYGAERSAPRVDATDNESVACRLHVGSKADVRLERDVEAARVGVADAPRDRCRPL